jgi:hypothetical protein
LFAVGDLVDSAVVERVAKIFARAEQRMLDRNPERPNIPW